MGLFREVLPVDQTATENNRDHVSVDLSFGGEFRCDQPRRVELGDHARVIVAHGSQCFTQAGSGTVGARQPVVDMNVLLIYLEEGLMPEKFDLTPMVTDDFTIDVPISWLQRLLDSRVLVSPKKPKGQITPNGTPPAAFRHITVTGSTEFYGYETIGGDEHGIFGFRQEPTLSTNDFGQVLLTWSKGFGGEERTEIDIDGSLRDDGVLATNIQMRFHEGATEGTIELEDSRLPALGAGKSNQQPQHLAEKRRRRLGASARQHRQQAALTTRDLSRCECPRCNGASQRRACKTIPLRTTNPVVGNAAQSHLQLRKDARLTSEALFVVL